MTLGLIRIKNLRNITEIEIEPAKGTNLIWGANGSGKTSLLEAIYILGRGRSFRNRENAAIIRKGQESLEIFGYLSEPDRERLGIGIRKKRKSTEARIGGEPVKKISLLARTLPISILTPRSHEILERGSQYRRRYLDWGVFHVEHSYRDVSERYHRILQQRNAALRRPGADSGVWDRELVETGKQLNQIREGYIETLIPNVLDLCSRFLPQAELSFEWRRGWKGGLELEEALIQTRHTDTSRGYTATGPHRADLAIKINGELADRVVSRGQQKMLVAAMKIAQAQLTMKSTGTDTVMLVDDLPAELDAENRERLLGELKESRLQVYITGVEKGLFQGGLVEKMFHVEHGQTRDVN
jgi:DNA replication and repair protein RecF